MEDYQAFKQIQMKLNIGDRIPAFVLPDQEGKLFFSNDMIGKKHLVIFFYPKDVLTLCGFQKQAFMNLFNYLPSSKFKIIGIMKDGASKPIVYQKNKKKSFTLLTDKNGVVTELFDAGSELFGLLPGRTTFIVDKQGFIRHKFSSSLRLKQHINKTWALQNITS